MNERGKNFIVGGILVAIVVLVVFVVGFAYQQDEPIEVGDRVVAATIFPIQDLTQQIAGEHVDVLLILPSGASPHTFEPTVATVKNLTKAEVIFSVGLGLDTWVENLGVNAELDVLEVSDGIPLIEEEEGEGHQEDHDDHDDHERENPHYWLSVPNAKTIVENITERLIQEFPELKTEFEANKATYLAELDVADRQIREVLGRVTDKNIVTFHNSFPYFTEEYDLEIVGTFEPAPGREPTPQYLKELQEGAEELEVSVIYSEPQLGTAQLESFVADLDLMIVELDPLGGIEGRDSYIEMMLFNAQTIADVEANAIRKKP